MEFKQIENNQIKPDNHLVWAILCTVLCCLPFGIVSIIKSSKVDGLWSQGLYDEARKNADEAKKWAIWGAAVGGIIVVLYILLMGVGIAAGNM